MPRKKTLPELPAESSGVVEAESVPSLTGHDASLIATENAESLPVLDKVTELAPAEPDAPVMARLRQKAEEEAREGRGATKGPHPYTYEVNSPGNVPDAYRDGNYDIDTALIDEHLQRCFNIDTTPQIPGLLIGRRV